MVRFHENADQGMRSAWYPEAAHALTAREAIVACPGLSAFILFKKMCLSDRMPVKAGFRSNAAPRQNLTDFRVNAVCQPAPDDPPSASAGAGRLKHPGTSACIRG